jgi:hypothetical protein
MRNSAFAGFETSKCGAQEEVRRPSWAPHPLAPLLSGGAETRRRIAEPAGRPAAMDALSVLQSLNEIVESALGAAAELAPDEPHADELRNRTQRVRKRRLSRPTSVEDAAHRGPDAPANIVGPRVTGGRWGSARREIKVSQRGIDDPELGPGRYDPNLSFVGRTKRAARIAQPTTKPLAAELKKFVEEERMRALGPGCYFPDHAVLSESHRRGGPLFAKPSIPPLPLLCKRFVEEEIKVRRARAQCLRCRGTAKLPMSNGVVGPQASVGPNSYEYTTPAPTRGAVPYRPDSAAGGTALLATPPATAPSVAGFAATERLPPPAKVGGGQVSTRPTVRALGATTLTWQRSRAARAAPCA